MIEIYLSRFNHLSVFELPLFHVRVSIHALMEHVKLV